MPVAQPLGCVLQRQLRLLNHIHARGHLSPAKVIRKSLILRCTRPYPNARSKTAKREINPLHARALAFKICPVFRCPILSPARDRSLTLGPQGRSHTVNGAKRAAALRSATSASACGGAKSRRNGCRTSTLL